MKYPMDYEKANTRRLNSYKVIGVSKPEYGVEIKKECIYSYIEFQDKVREVLELLVDKAGSNIIGRDVMAQLSEDEWTKVSVYAQWGTAPAYSAATLDKVTVIFTDSDGRDFFVKIGNVLFD